MTHEFEEMCRCRESYEQAKSAFEAANTRLYFARRNYDEAQHKWVESCKKQAPSQETPDALTSAEEESLRERSDLMHRPAEY